MVRDMVEMMTGAIVGVIAFLIVKSVITAIGTSGWSDLEIVLWVTIVPMIIAVAVILRILGGISA